MTRALRIAVADDEQDMREFFARMLPRCGHDVVSVAASGEQLITDCRRQEPDLVITDIKMPGIDGLEAATRICRERPTAVILVSAHDDSCAASHADAKHVSAYLVKPIVFADLAPAIATAVRRFEQAQSQGQEMDGFANT